MAFFSSAEAAQKEFKKCGFPKDLILAPRISSFKSEDKADGSADVALRLHLEFKVKYEQEGFPELDVRYGKKLKGAMKLGEIEVFEGLDCRVGENWVPVKYIWAVEEHTPGKEGDTPQKLVVFYSGPAVTVLHRPVKEGPDLHKVPVSTFEALFYKDRDHSSTNGGINLLAGICECLGSVLSNLS